MRRSPRATAGVPERWVGRHRRAPQWRAECPPRVDASPEAAFHENGVGGRPQEETPCQNTIRPATMAPSSSRFRANRTLSRHRRMADSDPDVWSGRALQEDFFGLADLRSCINVSGL